MDSSVEKITSRCYRVYSGNSEYTVVYDKGEWKCLGCRTYLTGRTCSHIREVWDYLVKEGKKHEKSNSMSNMQEEVQEYSGSRGE